MSRRPTYAEADAAHRRMMAAARVTVDALLAGEPVLASSEETRRDRETVDRYRAFHPGWRDSIGNQFADVFDRPRRPR